MRNTPAEPKDDAGLRRELLDVLYAGKDRRFVLVKPDSFSPLITMRDIFRLGCEFKEAEILKTRHRKMVTVKAAVTTNSRD